MLLQKSLIPLRGVTRRERTVGRDVGKMRAPRTPDLEWSAAGPLRGGQPSAPPRAGKLARRNRSPGGRQVLAALAAGSGSSVAEAPSILHRLPAFSRELREASRPLQRPGLRAQVPGQSQTSGSQARPPLGAPALDPARAPSAPCRPQLYLAAPLRRREALGPPPACDFQSLPWEKGSAEEVPGGGHTAGVGLRRDCLLLSHYPRSRRELSGHEIP